MKTKGSSRWGKQRIKVARLHERVANQRRDFLHKQSLELANRYDWRVIEDLRVKGMSQAFVSAKALATTVGDLHEISCLQIEGSGQMSRENR